MNEYPSENANPMPGDLDEHLPQVTAEDMSTDDLAAQDGMEPGDRPMALDEVGTTDQEQAQGEDLQTRLAREVPEDTAPAAERGELAEEDEDALESELADVAQDPGAAPLPDIE